MHTRVAPTDDIHIAEAAEYIQRGEVVAFPTETVYGLGADAMNETAVMKIFAAKERPADNPLIVHIAHLSTLTDIVEHVPDRAKSLIDAFWPGPLSLVLPKHPNVPKTTTAGLDTVVVRYPSHPTAQALIEAAQTPIAAPSANRSGNVSPTTAAHVAEDLDGRISLILDGGNIEFGLESTVVDCTLPTPTILRPGSITIEMLRAVVPDIENSQENIPHRSPGMKYRHYSPAAPVVLFVGNTDATEQAMRKVASEETVSITHSFPSDFTLPAKTHEAAPNIYHTLRQADAKHPKKILIQGYPETGVGAAIMNRLRKAAESVVDCN